MIPANTIVTCPSCETEFEVEFDMEEGQIIECDNCDVELQLENGDLKSIDEDIYDDEDDDGVEQNPQRPIGKFKQ